METLVFGTLQLHDYLHYPTKMLFILRFTDTETSKRILTQMLRKYLQSYAIQSHLTSIPLPDQWFAQVELSLSIGKFSSVDFGESSIKLFYPPKIECYLFFLAFLANLFIEVNKILGWFSNSLLVLNLLISFANFMFHIGEFDEGVGLNWLVGGHLNKSMKNAGHKQLVVSNIIAINLKQKWLSLWMELILLFHHILCSAPLKIIGYNYLCEGKKSNRLI